jgi:hypothetical protein
MDDTVVQLNIKPATHRYRHEGFDVVVSYFPETKEWLWTATKPVMSKIEWAGSATTMNRALAQAKRRINDNT